MTKYCTVLVLLVSNLCFLSGKEADIGPISPEELYIRQKMEFVNALGYESNSVVEMAEREKYDGKRETNNKPSGYNVDDNDDNNYDDDANAAASADDDDGDDNDDDDEDDDDDNDDYDDGGGDVGVDDEDADNDDDDVACA